MGWASGSEIMSEIINLTKRTIKDVSKRKSFYKNLIVIFENRDWDTEDECLGLDRAFDLAMKELYPDNNND
jgi:hypothetical protein